MPQDPLAPTRLQDRLMEVQHVARRLSCSPEYVRRLIRVKKLGAVRLGWRWRVKESVLLAFIEERETWEDEPKRQSSVQNPPHAVNQG